MCRKLLDSPTRFGQRFKMKSSGRAEVGTDDSYLKFSSRTVNTGVLDQDFETTSLSAAEASSWLTTTLMRRSVTDPVRTSGSPTDYSHARMPAFGPRRHSFTMAQSHSVRSPESLGRADGMFFLGDLEYDLRQGGISRCRHAPTVSARENSSLTLRKTATGGMDMNFGRTSRRARLHAGRMQII